MELECSNLDLVMWVAIFLQVGDGELDGEGTVMETSTAKGRRRRREQEEEEERGGGDDNGEKRGCWWEVGGRLV